MKTRLFCLLICLSAAPALADGGIKAAIDAADAARKEAAAVGHEWRYTGKWIKEARGALESGDTAKAKEMAERAQFEAEQALEQAEISKATWKIAVPR